MFWGEGFVCLATDSSKHEVTANSYENEQLLSNIDQVFLPD